ncbi:hypothetical protein [Iningainema tapete]|uniref:Uncharacterized protein n=1 Tax=Iningainema tapete BLCC-T55 TaxID=2748662 RepID=A0A8J6XHU1_9CYAN|nr:hypothetical protein [Iningainema tapete BLCC-T55]
MVQALHNQGLVYADSNQNAVFGMRSLAGETTEHSCEEPGGKTTPSWDTS